MAPIHPLRHSPHRKRRLFTGAVERAYLREERLRKIAEGHRPRRHRLFAGRLQAAYMRELRIEEDKHLPRREYSRHLKGEFHGYVKDLRIKR